MQTLASPLLLGLLTSLSLSLQAQTVQSREVQTRDGPVEVRWGQETPPDAGPRPDFSQLDRNGNGSIDEDEAGAFLPLVNDFINVDHDRNGAISAREYQRWQ